MRLLFFILLLTSCTTQLKYEMDNHKFLSPESKGELFSGDAGIGASQYQKVVVAEAFDPLIFNLPSTSNNQFIEQTYNLSLPLNMGVANPLDVFYQNSKLGLKYQFIGSSEKEKVAEFKLAASIAYGYEKQNESTSVYKNNNVTRTYSTAMVTTGQDLNLILGYRINEHVLFYLDMYSDFYQYKGTLSSNQFPTIDANGVSNNYGANLGISLNLKKFVIRSEAGLATGSVDSHRRFTVGSFASMLGFSW